MLHEVDVFPDGKVVFRLFAEGIQYTITEHCPEGEDKFAFASKRLQSFLDTSEEESDER